jgi:hypothetical protein
MKRSRTLPAVLIAAFLLISATRSPLVSQCTGATCTVTINMTVKPVLTIDLTGNNANTALGTPGQADFAAGGLTATGPTVTIKANGGYAVSVAATKATFDYAGAFNNPLKPASDLTWAPGVGAAPGSCSGVTSFGHNVGASTNLMSGSVGAPATNVSPPSQTLCYRTLWTFAASPPGTYTIHVVFTLSEP